MLSVQIDKRNGIAVLQPDGALFREDFESASKTIDAYLEQNKTLNGLIVHTKSFPGWDSFSALTSHLKFVKEHHKMISYVAIVTDSKIVNFSKGIASHFISAEIQLFSFQELELAKKWIEKNAKAENT